MNAREENIYLAHNSRLQSRIEGSSSEQELRTADHITGLQGPRETRAPTLPSCTLCLVTPFSFMPFRGQPTKLPPTFQVRLSYLISVKAIKIISRRHVHRPTSSRELFSWDSLSRWCYIVTGWYLKLPASSPSLPYLSLTDMYHLKDVSQFLSVSAVNTKGHISFSFSVVWCPRYNIKISVWPPSPSIPMPWSVCLHLHLHVDIFLVCRQNNIFHYDTFIHIHHWALFIIIPPAPTQELPQTLFHCPLLHQTVPHVFSCHLYLSMAVLCLLQQGIMFMASNLLHRWSSPEQAILLPLPPQWWVYWRVITSSS